MIHASRNASDIRIRSLFRYRFDPFSQRDYYALSGFLLICRWAFTVTGLLGAVQVVGRLVSRMIGSSPEEAASARQRISRLIKEGVGAGGDDKADRGAR